MVSPDGSQAYQYHSYFTEAFWTLFTDSAVLVALLTILIVAVLLPIAAHYAFAIWRLWKEERESGYKEVGEDEVVVESEVDEEVELKLVNEGEKRMMAEGDKLTGGINMEVVKKLRVQYPEMKSKNKTLGLIEEKKKLSFCPYGFGGFDIGGPLNGEYNSESSNTAQPPSSTLELEEESARIAGLVNSAAKSKSKPKSKKKLDAETTEALKHLTESGLHGKLATAQLHSKTMRIESEMSEEERQHERDVRNQQLAAIFSMMQAQGDKFGVQSQEELVEQMKLYSV